MEVAEPPRGRKKKSSVASAAAYSSSSTAAATAAQSQQNLFNGPAAFPGPFGAVAPSQGFGSGPFGAFGGGPQQGDFFGFPPNSWQAPFGSGGGWASGNSAAASGAFSMGGGFGPLHTFGSPGYEVVDPKSIPPSQGTPFSESFKSRCTNLGSLRSSSCNAAMSAGINRLHKMRETRSLLYNEAHAFSYFGHAAHLIHLELNRLASGMVYEPSALLELGSTLSMLSSSAIECAQNRAFRQRYFLQRDQLDFKGLGRADQTMAESYEISTTSSAGALAIEKALRDSASFVARKAREDGITVPPGSSSSTASSSVPFASYRSEVGGNARQRDK